MPFNFHDSKIYEIDYKVFFNELYSKFYGNLFSDEEKTKSYINTYLRYMKKADKKFNDFISNRDNFFALIDQLDNTQIFQQPIEYDNSVIYLHFLVGKLIESVPDWKNNSNDAPLVFFQGQKAKYFWTPAQSDITLSSDPIIAAPFPFEFSDYLIIDGNHRLTNWEKEKRSIPVTHVSANYLIRMDLFASEFDSLYYIFHCDTTNLANLKHYYNFSDDDLLKQTFLNTGKLPF